MGHKEEAALNKLCTTLLFFFFLTLSFIFTSFREQDEAYINSLRWSALVGLEPTYTRMKVARSTTVLYLLPTLLFMIGNGIRTLVHWILCPLPIHSTLCFHVSVLNFEDILQRTLLGSINGIHFLFLPILQSIITKNFTQHTKEKLFYSTVMSLGKEHFKPIENSSIHTTKSHW